MGPIRVKTSLAFGASLLLAVTLVPSVPFASAQSPSIELGDLTGPNPYTVDGGDALRLPVTNRELLPVSGTLRFFRDNTNPTSQIDSRDFQISGQSNQTIVFEWNGHKTPASQDLVSGSHTIHAKVSVNSPFTAPAPPNDQRSVTLFFRVFRVTVDPTLPASTEVEPGGTIAQLVHVQNNGNAVDNYTLSLTGGTAGWTFELDRTEVLNVLEGQAQAVQLRARPPSGARGGDTGQVQIVAQSRSLNSVQASAPSAQFRVGIVSGFQLAVDPAEITIQPGDRVAFTLTATNQGNRDLSLPLTAQAVTNFPPLSINPTPLTVPVGASATATAQADTLADTPAGAYVVPVKARDDASDLERTVFPTINVLQRFSLVATWPPDELATRTVEPDQSAEFVVRARNTGNGKDQFTVAPAGLPSGWTFVPQTGDPEVAADSFADYTVGIRVPPGQPPGSYTFGLVVTSKGDPGVSRRIEPQVHVPSVPVAKLTPATDKLPIEGGGSAVFTITIQNVGNARDTFDLLPPEVTVSDPTSSAWTAEWEGQPATVTLEPGQSTPRTVRAHAPSQITISSHADFLVKARSGDGRVGSTHIVVQSAAPDLRVLPFGLPAKVYVTRGVKLEITVENLGTMDSSPATTLQVTIEREANAEKTQSFSVASLSWQQGANRRVYSVDWLPANQAAYTITGRVDPGDLVAESSEDNNVRTLPVLARLSKPRLTGPGPRDAEPGESVSLDGAVGFTLRNEGSAAETFAVSASTTHAWGTRLTLAGLTLAPLESRLVPLVILVPARPGVLEDEVRMDVLGEGPGSASAFFSLRIRDTEPPVVTNVTATPSEAGLGLPVTIHATVIDATILQSVRAVVTDPEGAQATVQLARNGVASDDWTGTYVVNTVGPHRASITTQDAAVPANVASTQATPVIFQGISDDRPVLEFVYPAPGHVVRGVDSAQLVVRDPNGVRRVVVDAYRPAVADLPASPALVSAMEELLNGTRGPVRLGTPTGPEPESVLALLDALEKVGTPEAEAFARLLDADAWLVDRVLGPNNTLRITILHGLLIARPLPLGNPYEIHLGGLPEGDLGLLVEAENGFGGLNRTVLLLRIDNTAPRILKVTPSPRSGGVFLVVVMVEPTPDLATPRVVMDLVNGTQMAVTMRAVGAPGSFEAEVPSRGLVAWRVVVPDTVGNTEVRDFQVSGRPASAGSGASVPFAPAALVLLVLALAACGWRRSRP